eukprot:COSAG02_NODE_629_length_19328_cov_24.710333_10_plen_186_part_00
MAYNRCRDTAVACEELYAGGTCTIKRREPSWRSADKVVTIRGLTICAPHALLSAVSAHCTSGGAARGQPSVQLAETAERRACGAHRAELSAPFVTWQTTGQPLSTPTRRRRARARVLESHILSCNSDFWTGSKNHRVDWQSDWEFSFVDLKDPHSEMPRRSTLVSHSEDLTIIVTREGNSVLNVI